MGSARPGGTAPPDHRHGPAPQPAGDRPADVEVRLYDEQDRPVDTDMLRALAAHALRGVGVRDVQVDVTLVDDVRMAALNAAHMAADGPTDVLAFPIDRPGANPPGVPTLIGDVVLAPGVAARQGGEAGHGADAELRLLLVHGLLHLLGHDHADPDERRVMFSLTDDLLAGFRTAGSPPGRPDTATAAPAPGGRHP